MIGAHGGAPSRDSGFFRVFGVFCGKYFVSVRVFSGQSRGETQIGGSTSHPSNPSRDKRSDGRIQSSLHAFTGIFNHGFHGCTRINHRNTEPLSCRGCVSWETVSGAQGNGVSGPVFDKASRRRRRLWRTGQRRNARRPNSNSPRYTGKTSLLRRRPRVT